MKTIYKKSKRFLILILFLILAGNPIWAEEDNKAYINLEYLNEMLKVEARQASIKEIFEELKLKTGIDFEIEKEILERKVTIVFEEENFVSGLEKILDSIGNPNYMLKYEKDEKGTSHIVSIYISNIGKREEETDELQNGDMENELVEEVTAKKSNIKSKIVKKSRSKIKKEKTEEKEVKEENEINEGTILSKVEVRKKEEEKKGERGSKNVELVGTFGKGRFEKAGSIAFSSDNKIVYVVDEGTESILAFNKMGDFLFSFGNKEKLVENKNINFVDLRDLAVDKEGKVYGADSFMNRIYVYNSEGNYVNNILLEARLRLIKEGKSVSSIAFNSRGDIYITDRLNKRLEIRNSKGKYKYQITRPNSSVIY